MAEEKNTQNHHHQNIAADKQALDFHVPLSTQDLEKSQQELKQSQKNLQESQDFLASIINNSHDSIQIFEAVRNEQDEIIDFTWLITNSNTAIENGNVIGKRLLQQEPGMITSEIFGHMLRVTQTGIPWELEQQYSNKESKDQWFYQAIVKYKDGILMTTRNITSQKRADLQILKNKNLLQMIMDASDINFAKTNA